MISKKTKEIKHRSFIVR